MSDRKKNRMAYVKNARKQSTFYKQNMSFVGTFAFYYS